jgi:hypothetical protein
MAEEVKEAVERQTQNRDGADEKRRKRNPGMRAADPDGTPDEAPSPRPPLESSLKTESKISN